MDGMTQEYPKLSREQQNLFNNSVSMLIKTRNPKKLQISKTHAQAHQFTLTKTTASTTTFKSTKKNHWSTDPITNPTQSSSTPELNIHSQVLL
jgi:hypothetical protein